MNKKDYSCPVCGSDNIYADGQCSWDFEGQQWVMVEKPDAYFCGQCGDDIAEPNENVKT